MIESVNEGPALYFLEQLRIRKAIAREEWAKWRHTGEPLAYHAPQGGVEVVCAPSQPFASYWAGWLDVWLRLETLSCTFEIFGIVDSVN